ncbi:MAG: hypothetical protein CMD29_03205 [Flavobacteriales bacterium]|nr:hypothetical protein [Flavobacteriales bacterium]|tara:strand:- start:689 stop:1777 length:1089 start_codon:yes stop_codon:yes gene_type:complete
MNDEYLIVDPRPLEAFKDKTFSEFKKRDVFNTLFKSIEMGKVENACFWITECVISGYTVDIFEKLIIFASKIIHINNPRLPKFIWNKYSGFMKSIDHISKKERKQYIHLRNTQSVRNCLHDIVVTLTLSSKSKRYDKYPKPKENLDFTLKAIQETMNATMQVLPNHIIKFTDPEELRIIMNEFFFNLKNNLGGYEKASYWISWLIQWEKINKKNKIKYEIEERPIQGLKKHLCKDIIWLIWSVIFEEANLRNIQIKEQIQVLFFLFKYNFSSGKRNSRLPLVYHAIGYLTLPIRFDIPIRNSVDIFIQTQCNINKMYQSKKKNEIKEYLEPPKPVQKISGSEKEISQAQLTRIQEIDEIFFQ